MSRAAVADEPLLPPFARHLPITRAAITYASRLARERPWPDDSSRIAHPLEVASLLYATGSPDGVVAAGVLHEVIEEGWVTLDEVARRFGRPVARLVGEVSEDSSIRPLRARKAALRAQVRDGDPAAGEIFAADKVSRVRQMRERVARAWGAGESESRDCASKLEHYAASLEMLESCIPEHPLVARLRRDLDSLLALAPAAPAAAVGASEAV